MPKMTPEEKRAYLKARMEEVDKIARSNNFKPFTQGAWVGYLDKIRFDRMGQIICELVVPRDYMPDFYPLFGSGRIPLLFDVSVWQGPEQEQDEAAS